MKAIFSLSLAIILLFSIQSKAQVSEMIYFGEIVFTHEPTNATKKKELAGLESFTLEDQLYGTLFLKMKIKNHPDFRKEEDHYFTYLTVKNAEGEKRQMDMKLDLSVGE